MANSNSLRKTTLGKALGSARDYILSRQKSSVSASGTFVNREEASKRVHYSVVYHIVRFDSIQTGFYWCQL